MACLHDPTALGQTYEAVGPERMTQQELLRFMYALTSRVEEDGVFKFRELMTNPETFAKAFIANKLKIGNVNCFHQTGLDRLERDSISDTSDGYPEITELGVKLHTVADKMPWEVSPKQTFSIPFLTNNNDFF